MKKPNGNKVYRKLYIETSIQKVAEVLFLFPEKEFSLSDLAKEAGVAKANMGKILDELYKIEFIKIIKLSKIWRIKANQTSQNFIKNKIIYNLNSLYQSGLIEFVNEYYNNPKAVILFGSFRKGDDISDSDVDIAIEIDEIEDYKLIVRKHLSKFENAIGRKIQIHLFNKHIVDINVFNNFANGIVLSGFLEVRP